MPHDGREGSRALEERDGYRIERISIEGKTYPFGGICDRYNNIRHHRQIDSCNYNLSDLRQKLIFEEYAADLSALPDDAPVVGINRSLLVNTYYPFFSVYFRELGMRPLLSPRMDVG